MLTSIFETLFNSNFFLLNMINQYIANQNIWFLYKIVSSFEILKKCYGGPRLQNTNLNRDSIYKWYIYNLKKGKEVPTPEVEV